MADLSLDESRKEEQLAEGILSILSPAVQKVDENIGDVRWTPIEATSLWTLLLSYAFIRKSQAQLKDKIDYLAEGK